MKSETDLFYKKTQEAIKTLLACQVWDHRSTSNVDIILQKSTRESLVWTPGLILVPRDYIHLSPSEYAGHLHEFVERDRLYTKNPRAFPDPKIESRATESMLRVLVKLKVAPEVPEAACARSLNYIDPVFSYWEQRSNTNRERSIFRRHRSICPAWYIRWIRSRSERHGVLEVVGSAVFVRAVGNALQLLDSIGNGSQENEYPCTIRQSYGPLLMSVRHRSENPVIDICWTSMRRLKSYELAAKISAGIFICRNKKKLNLHTLSLRQELKVLCELDADKERVDLLRFKIRLSHHEQDK